jgi:CRP-like cAMP-binding protein
MSEGHNKVPFLEVMFIMPRHNLLINSLPDEVFDRIRPHLESAPMPQGEVLYESGDSLCYAYFPTTSIVSLLYELENGSSAEIAVVGNEGMIGVALLTGGGTMPHRAVVRSAGDAYRLKGSLLKNEFNRDGVLHRLLLHYIQALMTQISQTAVCNRHHSIDQQLCRCLLLSLDRLPSNELVMTQELIATMLGVRREGITEAAGRLQEAGLIRYSRGHITIEHREGLEERVCECYNVVKEEFDRLLPCHCPLNTARFPLELERA